MIRLFERVASVNLSTTRPSIWNLKKFTRSKPKPDEIDEAARPSSFFSSTTTQQTTQQNTSKYTQNTHEQEAWDLFFLLDEVCSH
jgi:hypothetical protein